MGRKVIIGQLEHETNTFNTCPTELVNFANRLYFTGEDILLSMSNRQLSTTGFIDVAKEYGWDVIPSVAAAANPGGKVSKEAWDILAGGILDAVRNTSDLDGICLGLHGAMVTEDHDDAEGALISQIREIVGPDVPIAVTLDLHGNISDEMCQQTNIVVSYKTYPHVDMRQCGRRAARLLEEAMSGKIKPRCTIVRRPLLVGANNGRTTEGQMVDLLACAEEMMQEPGVLDISINAGFTMADTPYIGPSVTVTGDGKSPRYVEIGEELMDRIWQLRDEFSMKPIPAEDAINFAKNRQYDGKPLVISDYSDNPGSGAYGDATNLLKAMIDANLEDAAFGAFCDKELASDLCSEGVGKYVTCVLGGKNGSAIGGGALAVSGLVVSTGDGKYIGDAPMSTGNLGPCAVLRVEGIDILIISFRQQVVDLQMFTSNGINLLEKKTIVVKSKQHFRAAFDPVASEVIFSESFGLASQDVTARVYRKVRRPIYPLDK
ncbi:M81 family metallopeptidase [uncultured Oceanisphaera sp.]|uniref:M81 family metallopeptidase n=1 Tax=uncultured Oceanisphaera sp. TaxID=353858 RepID=UPI0026035515|nr:M81 family metallopeptidase [uncultured Oceanisphaera sp.]